jgi:hypothetical protein
MGKEEMSQERKELKRFLTETLKTVQLKGIYNFLKKHEKVTILKQETNYLPADSELTERIYQVMNDMWQRPKCLNCEKETKFANYNTGYNTFCSSSCYNHSTDHAISASLTYYKKTEAEKKLWNNNKKLAFLNKSKNDWKLIKAKQKKTLKEKYDNENYRNTKKVKETWYKKFYNSLITGERLNGEYKPLFSLADFSGVRFKKYKWLHIVCGTEFEDDVDKGHLPRCPKCYRIYGSSDMEREIAEWLAGLIQIERNKKFGTKYELDIFIPSKNVGIEFDGLYWHGEVNGGKPKNYHLDKTKFFEAKKIQLLHVFEDEWIDKQDIVKSIILAKLGIGNNVIYARKCVIQEVKSPEAKLFLFDNHIQGEINAKIYLGLYYNNELVSLMSFGKPRYNKNFDWEMLRFCNKVNMNIVGGAGKLVNYFLTHHPGSLISYADRRYSMGNLYEKLGFTKINESAPNYYYTNRGVRYSRIQFQKHKLKDKLETFDPKLTEWQNMQLNGWDRIWDCGNLVYKI